MRYLGLCLATMLLIAGCPTSQTDETPAVVARIGVSSTTGAPPLRVFVSAADSTSTRGPIERVQWNFADQATSENVEADWVFTSPGLYPITLLVVDATGEQATARQNIRVQGAAPTAVISADPSAGPAPLRVVFDASGSSAPDDVIRDYAWDFGDGDDSSEARPAHVYSRSGEYDVTLTVTTAGGVSATAAATVTVAEEAGGSLQFDGGQLATLPVAAATLDAFTFEAWVNPDALGGPLAIFGSPSISIEVDPAASVIRLRSGATVSEASGFVSAGAWSHVAVSYDAAAGATIVLNGAELTTISLSGSVSVSSIQLGAGLRGNATLARFWSVARSTSAIAANRASLSGDQTGLLGAWPCNEGSGQTLNNQADPSRPGSLGASSATEVADPAWSSDRP